MPGSSHRLWLPLTMALVLMLAGCVQPWNGDAQQGPASPSTEGDAGRALLSVNLQIGSPEDLFEDGIKLTLTVKAASNGTRLVAGVNLPDGVTVRSGNLSYDGPITYEQPVIREAIVRADEPGRYLFRGWAERPQWVTDNPYGSRMAKADLVGIEGNAQQADRFPPRYDVSVDVDLDVDPDRPEIWWVNVTAPTNASARLILHAPPPTGAETSPVRLEQGAWIQQVSLTAGQTETVPYRVSYPDNDTYFAEVTVHLHPSIDTAKHGDAFRVTIDGDRVQVQDADGRGDTDDQG